MALKRTQKKEDQLHTELYNKAVRRVREMLPPQTLAEAMYPNLKTKAEEEQPKQGPIQGWSHLRKK